MLWGEVPFPRAPEPASPRAFSRILRYAIRGPALIARSEFRPYDLLERSRHLDEIAELPWRILEWRTRIRHRGGTFMPSEHDTIDSQKVIGSLNTILELELAGVVRYLHYSLMVFGHARIPIIGWMRNQATEGMNHAAMAGEHVTSLGGHPSLNIGKLVESHKHDITQILGEALDHERATLREY